MTPHHTPHALGHLGEIALALSLTEDQIGEPRTYVNVERAFTEMHWDAGEADMVRFHNKTIDEPDLGGLWLLCFAAQHGGLLRKYRGAFEKTRLAFLDGYPDDPLLQQQVPQIL